MRPVKYLTKILRLCCKGAIKILDTVYCIQWDKHIYGILSSGRFGRYTSKFVA